MFDIGFWEVIFIAVITLLVVGPERLPKVARTAGLWVGKIRGFVVSVKADIDKELASGRWKSRRRFRRSRS
jgi:sec-independent protein translocase protein TatB